MVARIAVSSCPQNLSLGDSPAPSVRKIGPEPSESAFTTGGAASVRKLGFGMGSRLGAGASWAQPYSCEAYLCRYSCWACSTRATYARVSGNGMSATVSVCPWARAAATQRSTLDSPPL